MPRRDIGNEVIVALAAVGMLALALAFGVVLTISRLTPNNTASTATQVAQASSLPVTLVDLTSEGTTETPTESITASATEIITETPTEQTTQATTGQPEATRTKSVTNTDTPTSVLAFTPTGTPTPSPSETPHTSTATPFSIFTTLTQEPVVLTQQMQTIQAIIKPRLTLTAFASMTFAQIVATQTENAIEISETPDITGATATDFPDFIDTPTPGIAPAPTSVLTAGCVVRAGWIPYIVQPSDTLFHLSVRAGISLQELQQANCISDASKIYYGQVIVVPPTSALATPGSSSGTSGGSGGTPAAGGANVTACGNLAARITGPVPGATVRGTITVSGAATIPNFDFYKLDVRADSSAVWNNFVLARTPVTNGALGTLNTGLFPPGLYWIQLTVIDKTGNYPILPCAVRVQFAR